MRIAKSLGPLLLPVALVFPSHTAAATVRPTVHTYSISYPIGRANTCHLGWSKETATHRVKGKLRRYVVCAIVDGASKNLAAPAAPSYPLPAYSNPYSQTWSGYAMTSGGPYTSISAQWVEPQLDCAASPANATLATWVGIDGDNEPQLFQSGTESGCSGTEQVDIAWFTDDNYGFNPQTMPFGVSPGDTIYSRDWEVSPGLWQYVVADLTNGGVATSRHGIKWSGPGNTAEWIVEDPGALNGHPPTPFPIYGAITFQDLGLDVAGHQAVMPSWGSALDLYDPATGLIETNTSPIVGSGVSEGFTSYGGLPSAYVSPSASVTAVAPPAGSAPGSASQTAQTSVTLTPRTVPGISNVYVMDIEVSGITGPTTGTITVTDNGQAANCSPAPVTSQSAAGWGELCSLNYQGTAAGSHKIDARYSGDATFAPSESFTTVLVS